MPKNKSQQEESASAGQAPINKPASAVKKSAKKPASKNSTVDQPAPVAAQAETARREAGAVDVTAPIVDDIESTDLEAANDRGLLDDSLMTDVVFRLRAHDDVREIVLVGDFNGWSQAAHHMARNGDSFEVTVPLERDRRYRYRYLVDGNHWENDWNADEYVPNDYGRDDSVRIV